MARPRNIIIPNAERSDYTCLVRTQNGVYDRKDIHTKVSRADGKKTTVLIDVNTGEVLYTRSRNLVSEQNSKFHIYSTCTDFAKSKNVPRVKVKSEGRHIIDLIKEHRNYLQCSTGSTHRTRGIIAVDIDRMCGCGDMDSIRREIEERLCVCGDLGVPMPSSYQVHKTNGHVQLFWVLDNEITINEVKTVNVDCGGEKKAAYSFIKNENWGRYINAMRFLSTVLGGDPQFTGWQIKNMFFTPDVNEMVFFGEFCTIWRNGDCWTETEPTKVETCTFESIDSVVDVFMTNPSDELLGNLMEIVSKHGGSRDSVVFGLKMCSGFRMSADAKSFYNVSESDVDESCDANFRVDAEMVNMGRNQFVRMKTLEVIRRKQGKVSREWCYAVVKREFDKAVRDGIIKGTFDHEREYTESDFDRDFDSTYDYGVNNYKSMQWSDEQRDTAAKTNRSKKTRKLALLIGILEEHPNLIRNTAKNNREIIDIFKELYDIEIKTVNTVSNYKRELKLKDKQKKVGKRNYRSIAKRSESSEEYYESVKNVYDRLLDFGFFGDVAGRDTWKRRVSSIGGNDVYRIYRESYSFSYNKCLYEPKGILETPRYTWSSETYMFSSMGCWNKERFDGRDACRDLQGEMSKHSPAPPLSERDDLCGCPSQRPPLHDGVPL